MLQVGCIAAMLMFVDFVQLAVQQSAVNRSSGQCIAANSVCCTQACKQCQALNGTELQPPQLRQQTTTAVARRLIGNALNVAGVHDKVVIAV